MKTKIFWVCVYDENMKLLMNQNVSRSEIPGLVPYLDREFPGWGLYEIRPTDKEEL